MIGIIVSDLHADWATDGFERLDDVRQALRHPIEHAEQLKADGEEVAFFCLGDVSNPNSRAQHRAVALIHAVAAELSGAGIPNVWLVGNHDVIEDGHGSHVLLALEQGGRTGTHVVSRPGFLTVHGREFGFLPFTPLSHAYDARAFVEEHASHTPAAVFGHLSIPGILYQGSETTDMPRGRDIRFPADACRTAWPKARLFNGHYHTRQTMNGIDIPGSLVRLTHGEEGNENGYLVEEF